MAKVVHKGYGRSSWENVVIMTSKGGKTGRDKSRGGDVRKRARKEKGHVAVRTEGRRGLNKQGHEVALGF